MILFYILLIALIVSNIKYNHTGFYQDYLSFDTTNAIKGVFIALVFIKHITPYIIDSGYSFEDNIMGRIFLIVDAHIGQWIVAMFLFYSGYGIASSIKKKGSQYVSSIPKKRILTTLINFDIAVTFFAIISIFIPTTFSVRDYLLALTAWESIGNSNWYIFVILICYFIAYCSFQDHIAKKEYSIIICLFLLVMTIITLSYLKPSWWYDTMLCFWVGIFYSTYQNHITRIQKQHYWLLLIGLILLMTIFAFIPYSAKGLVYNGYCALFCLIVVLITMKLKINNKMLIWAGENLFPLYIYQRIPMIILASIDGGNFVLHYPVVYTLFCLLITISIAHFYKYLTVKL